MLIQALNIHRHDKDYSRDWEMAQEQSTAETNQDNDTRSET